jgi:hypothetical protein
MLLNETFSRNVGSYPIYDKATKAVFKELESLKLQYEGNIPFV